MREQDGIVARLDTAPPNAVFSWRFIHRPPDVVDRVEASVNGRHAGAPTRYQSFAESGAITLVTILIDTGGLERAREIEAAEQSILETLASLPSNVSVTVATYNTAYRAIERPASLAEFLVVASPRDVASNLSTGLAGALADGRQPAAARRAIYVYTDGFDLDLKSLAALKVVADTNDTSVSFVVQSSMRLVDLATIEDFARATKGRIFTRASDVQVDVATFLTSGASVQFSLDAVRRLFWQPEATATATLWYGDRHITVSQMFDQPVAGLDQTVRYLLDQDIRVVATGSLTAFASMGFLLWWIFRRFRKSATSPAIR